MQTARDLIRSRLDVVRRDLDRTLARIYDEDFDWAPAPGMRTIGGLLFEIAGKEVELMNWAKRGGGSGEADWREVEDFGGKEKSLAGMKETLVEIRQGTLAYLENADLEAVIKFPGNWWEGLNQTEVPMHEVFRSIAMHEWYHTGQLVSYLWSKGDDPYFQ